MHDANPDVGINYRNSPPKNGDPHILQKLKSFTGNQKEIQIQFKTEYLPALHSKEDARSGAQFTEHVEKVENDDFYIKFMKF